MRKIALFVAILMPIYTTIMVVAFAMSDIVFTRDMQWFLGMAYFIGYGTSILAAISLENLIKKGA